MVVQLQAPWYHACNGVRKANERIAIYMCAHVTVVLTLQALEAIVLRSPQEAEPQVAAILELTLASLAYDPNYADDMEEDEDGEEDPDDDDGYD